MTSEYRLTTAADREQFYQLYLYAFNGQDSEARRRFFYDRYDHGWIYGLHHDHQLTSGLYSLPFTVNFHGVDYKMNGIGDVMSAPEDSGHGGAGTLLKAALAEMLAQHVTLSYLAPFAFTYYRRFGYEQVFHHITYTVNHGQVPAYRPHSQTGHVTRMTFEAALPLIKPVYAEAAKHLAGGVVREDWWWHYLTLKHNWDVGVSFTAAGEVDGYVIYERSADAMTVQEFAPHSQAAFELLASFVLKHGNSFKQLRFEDADSRYQADWVADPYAVQAVVTPYMMARIVDLQDFLQRYPYQADFAPVTVAVQDDILPVNAGNWTIGRTNGAVAVAKTADDPALTTTIQVLAKALMGTASAHQLWLRGELTGDEAAATRLDAGLHHTLPSLIDYF